MELKSRDGGRAQDIADDALGLTGDLSEDSEHGGEPDPAAVMPDDVPDLFDTMNQMVSSGPIDNGAFEGVRCPTTRRTDLGRPTATEPYAWRTERAPGGFSGSRVT